MFTHCTADADEVDQRARHRDELLSIVDDPASYADPEVHLAVLDLLIEQGAYDEYVACELPRGLRTLTTGTHTGTVRCWGGGQSGRAHTPVFECVCVAPGVGPHPRAPVASTRRRAPSRPSPVAADSRAGASVGVGQAVLRAADVRVRSLLLAFEAAMAAADAAAASALQRLAAYACFCGPILASRSVC